MKKSRTVRFGLSGMIAGAMMFSAVSAMPAVTNAQEPDANGYYYHDTFENGTDDWEGRGGASVSTGGTAYAGSKALTVSDRGSSWHGAQKALDSQTFKAGEEYSFSAAVSGSGNMMLSLQYTDASGKTAYGHIASGQSEGDYVLLSNTNYKLPEGSGYILYVETEDGTASFSVDEVIAAKAGTQPDVPQPINVIQGDFNGDERVDIFDLVLARKSLVSYTSGSATDTVMTVADIDCDGEFAVNDIVMLSKFILGKVKEFPEPIVTTTTTTAPPVTTTTTSNADPSAYMASIRDKITVNVPQNVLKNAEGKIEHITYFSKKANRNKGANVWLPPGYDSSKKYPVFYVNHGYGGDEFSMMNGMGVREIATNLIKSGEAEPMIIVFANQYTDPNHEKQTGNGQADVPGYDNFVEDMPDSLMPYIESHYPVKTGRENTAVAGFSMGGRESLYIGMKCCDKVGYIGGGAPAPGIFPTRDQFMTHPGVMSKDDMRIDPPYSPYILMIAGGTNDTMVNDFPKQYSDLFTQHGTENIYISVPGGGHDSNTVIPLMYNFIRFIFKA
ncbi:carbohydrate binding domain-containing protein [Ruminococcus flavefaciens]|uniref:carbohydrate binding domain-containing protein n=1 Tax=Ruminococcus flavefaciens TaxID=1265 RepID=UPI0006859228|nr:carbohydrate binding domain-containing protein [Ruminococcus flavefaciens]